MSGEKSLVEVIILLPIRRSFRQEDVPPPDSDFGGGVGDGVLSLLPRSPGAGICSPAHRRGCPLSDFPLSPASQSSGPSGAGHLIWAPFGPQEVQGIIVGPASSSPVETKAISRLSRPLPVLTPAQLDMAFWIADYYVAPVSESVKLFLTPGLLSKSGEPPRVRVKREEQVELLIEPETVRKHLIGLGRTRRQDQILTVLLAAPSFTLKLDELRKACNFQPEDFVRSLQKKELVRVSGDRLSLAQSDSATVDAILRMRGTSKYEPVLNSLALAAAPVWKSDLYKLVDTDLAMLRRLRDAGLIRIEQKVRYRDPLGGRIYRRTHPLKLTDQQQHVWDEISRICFPDSTPKPLNQGSKAEVPVRPTLRSGSFLLHGATGSGKTEIYLRAIAETLSRNRQAIVLVPEIALTPQTVARFAGRFPDRVSVIHSGLSASQRYDVWRRARDGQIDVIVGARSALFSPLPRLGLIVVDEEHESTYKQDTDEWGSFTVFYDARSVAIRLAEVTGSALIFGTATPSLDSYHAAQRDRLKLLEMPERVLGHGESDDSRPHEGAAPPAYASLPPVEIVDMRQELRAGNRSIFSRSLQSELHTVLDAGEQAILFLNRRGTHSFVMCRDCGFVAECARCETPLTFHERAAQLICHRCNRREPIPDHCPACRSHRIRYFGTGTQRIEELVSQIAPRARLLRWDRDTTGRQGSHEQILDRFASHEADVLIGTQMIAKGLDLPLVTLVGVVAADVGLYLPDFRGPERTFQLLTQVAGRAGRSRKGGRVIFQSYTPQHYALQAAAGHDYHAFYQREMEFRREQHYPPVSRLARLIFWHKKLETVEGQTNRMMRNLQLRAEEMGIWGEGVDLLGPAPAPYARFRGYYRWHIIVRAADPSAFLQGMDIPFGWRIDIDPVSMM